MKATGSVAGIATATDMLDLLDWKRRIFALYAEVRADEDPQQAWRQWRAVRDDLFRAHAQSPLTEEARSHFGGVDYFPYDPACRVLAELSDLHGPAAPVETSGPEPLLFRPFATASFELGGQACRLELLWLEGYGGGLFLCFRDGTSGAETYGGGRYLLDTVKGADLGREGDAWVVDLNFAYNPSCAYDPAWACPLAPAGNRLTVDVPVGELTPLENGVGAGR